MRHIITIYEKDVYPNTKSEVVIFDDRLTVKAIVFDSARQIALVGNKQNKYFQLPGGGVDQSEDLSDSLKRECLEEIGCIVSQESEVGYIDDYRSRDKKHCINYCYVASVIGGKGQPKYTDNEMQIGMFIKWISVDEALKLFENQKQDLEAGLVTFYNTGFNILRDFFFLRNAIDQGIIK